MTGKLLQECKDKVQGFVQYTHFYGQRTVFSITHHPPRANIWDWFCTGNDGSAVMGPAHFLTLDKYRLWRAGWRQMFLLFLFFKYNPDCRLLYIPVLFSKLSKPDSDSKRKYCGVKQSRQKMEA